ncbi:MAG: hypothetical protein H6Q33_4207 [Deltaproteobacteria bacterium]|nr:hypothetical protein [Deltaproteobacteria bacterium]
MMNADYSGEFDPEFSLETLSRETLLKLLKAYTEYMLRIDGHWYLTVMGKWGNAEAFECDVKVWEKAQVYELKSMTSLLNIQGDDVATVMKAIQASPWMGIYDYKIDLKNKDHAVATYFKCPTLSALEKEGTGREELICRHMEPKLMGIIAHYFNPKITVTPLKVPPRTYDDCCCQWEFKLER